MKKSKTFYVTTPIFYPSGNLHIGHLYSASIAWFLKNYKSRKGYQVLFLTGSDEHGQKIYEQAKKNNQEPQEYVDLQAKKFINFWKLYGIDFDVFSRTTNLKHKKVVKKIFSYFLERKLVYLDKYKGWYSISDEEFVSPSQILKDEKGVFLHPVSKNPLTLVEEESYFFDMKKFEKWIFEFLEKEKVVSSNKTRNELVNNFLKDGLENLSVTRNSVKWGIKIKENSCHLIYVWLDALFNYVTNIGFDFENSQIKYLNFWEKGDEIVHVVGKEITRFHCIYWPIFLKALGIRRPTKILSHGWIVTPEGKMSKSKGNVIDPLKLLEHFENEEIKCFLLTEFSLKNDNSFSLEKMKEFYNVNLANNFGNLFSRTISLVNQSFVNKSVFFDEKLLTDKENQLIEKIKNRVKLIDNYFDNFQIDKGFQELFFIGHDLNCYVDESKPWNLKSDLKQLKKILNLLLNFIYVMGFYLEIVMPNKMIQLKKILGIKENFQQAKFFDFSKFDNLIIGKNEILFVRKKN